MVYVAHYGDDRRTRLQVFFVVRLQVEFLCLEFLFRVIHVCDMDADAQLIRQHGYGVLVDILVDICHDPELHESHDDLRR